MGLITTENAREMAAKANAAIAARKEAARVAVEIAVSSPELDFAERTLTRVRLQMDKLATEIDNEITGESKRLKELTDAYSRLADQERILAGRPMPGSRKPAPERATKSRRDLGAVEPSQSAPAPQAVAYNPASPDAPNG